MEASDSITTEPMSHLTAKDIAMIAKIDAVEAEYRAYVALDHELAIQGLKDAAEQLRGEQNGC